MSILNYLPTFKVVEMNRSTGLIAGHVLAQFPLAGTAPFIANVGGIDTADNGYIVGLGGDLKLEGFDPEAHGVAFVIFTEELNTVFNGLKYFTNAAYGDGDIYPRAVALYVGDVFTTNNYTAAANAKFAKVVAGKLTLQAARDEDTLFAVEEATLPLGDEAYRFIYLGPAAKAAGVEG